VYQHTDGAGLFAYRPSRRRNRLDIRDVEARYGEMDISRL
jgi:hypothetical protein